jgi:hypothetical protein
MNIESKDSGDAERSDERGKLDGIDPISIKAEHSERAER